MSEKRKPCELCKKPTKNRAKVVDKKGKGESRACCDRCMNLMMGGAWCEPEDEGAND